MGNSSAWNTLDKIVQVSSCTCISFACRGLWFFSPKHPKPSGLQFTQLLMVLRRDGEDIEETDPKDGCRPLHAAVITEQEDAVRYLLRKLCRKLGELINDSEPMS